MVLFRNRQDEDYDGMSDLLTRGLKSLNFLVDRLLRATIFRKTRVHRFWDIYAKSA